MTKQKPIHIVGGGLAGSEAAWQIAQQGYPVVLHEMRPNQKTKAHHTEHFAELVCSNSFRSDDAENNAVGLLHQEMRLCNSLIMEMGDRHKVPAGSALAVDRDAFAMGVSDALNSHPLITIERQEIRSVRQPEWESTIIATGPLTSDALSTSIIELTGEEELAFFDAIAPIIYRETIDFDVAWFQSRYDKGDTADYINCPMNRDQYEDFVQSLLDGDKTDFKDWEKDTPYFEGCMPIEVMAERGPDTLRFGPMKPVGLSNPNSDERPWAVVQLRQDNKLGTLFNMVGFQTKLKYGAQSDIFRKIPGLENAEFARLGGLHRNTFINSPKLLDKQLRLKSHPSIRFAGQITGVEGYVESAAIGLLAGRFAAHEQMGNPLSPPEHVCALGALLEHITGGHLTDSKKSKFQPMNINFGLFPELEQRYIDVEINGKIKRQKIRKAQRKPMYSRRALESVAAWA